jgi:erythronate-4-phosphate dehydrogenase
VAEFIAAVLLEVERRLCISLRRKRLGVIGVGNVGSKVVEKAAALGLECVLNDPPLAQATGDPKYRSIDDVFDCDFVALHVPLTRDGPDATYHLVNEEFIRNLKAGTVLINTSRGAVMDTPAVISALDRGLLKACVLDVWEGEPRPDPGMVERAFIGTSHIAGYSFDGKVNGTRQIYEAACRFFGRPSEWDPSPLLPRPECPEIVMRGDAECAVYEAVRAVYDIMRDDEALRAILHVPETERGAFFDRLRKYYPRRREFFNTRVVIRPPNAELTATLKGLGFQCQEK